MKARLAASALLALGIAVGASGCTFITYQATTERYDASDGISANVGELDIRNALVVTDDGEDGVLAMTVVNTGSSRASLDVQFDGASGRETVSVDVPAGESVVFGGQAEGAEPPIGLEGLGAAPGSLAPLYFQYGQAEGADKLVPVLDGTLPEYAALLD